MDEPKTYSPEPMNVAVGAQLAKAPMSQVQEASSVLDKEISMLHDAIGSLENRLRPVLTPVPQNETTDGGEPGGGSELRHDLVSKARVVRVARERIQQLLETLEV